MLIIFLKEFIELNGHDDKKCETCRIKYNYCDCFLEYTNFEDDLIEYKCLCCNKSSQQKLDEKLDFLIHTNFLTMIEIGLFYYCKNVSILMNVWMIGKNSVKRYYLKNTIFTDFEIKNSGEYYDLYVKNDTSLLADVFENFRNMCLKIHELDPAKQFSAPGLELKAALKKTKVKLHLLTDIDMLLMVEKVLAEEYVTLFIDMQKLVINI